MLRMGRRRQGEFVPEEKNQAHFKTRDVPLLVCTFICLWGRCPNKTFFISELLPTHRLNWYHLQRNAWFFSDFFFFPYFSIISWFIMLCKCTFLWDDQDQEQWSQINRIIKGADESLPREDYRFLYIMRSLIMIQIIPKKRTLLNHLKPRRLILGRNLIYRFFILSFVFSSWFYYFF